MCCLFCCRPCVEFGIAHNSARLGLSPDVVDAVQFPQHTRGDRIGLNAPSCAHESTFSFLQELWLCATLPFASSTHNFPSGEVRNQLINIYISVSLEPSKSETPHLTADCGQLTADSTETVKSRSARSGNTARVTSLANDVTRVFFSTVSTSAHPHLLAREQNKHLSEPAYCWSLVSLRCTACWVSHELHGSADLIIATTSLDEMSLLHLC